MDIKDLKVGFIGCGMMGGALIQAVVKTVRPENVFIFDTKIALTEKICTQTGATATSSSVETAEKVDYLFLAVKPAYIADVLSDITTLVPEDKLPIFVSIAAGVKLEILRKVALIEAKFLRLMPNLPATVGEAMIALTCDDDISDEQVNTVKEILKKAGVVEQVPEQLMDCVTGVSGSGPAYGFIFIEALADAACKLGMSRKQAIIYAAQTLKGAATMVLQTGRHPAELKDAVCSPAGTTIAGVEKLEEYGFRNAIIKAAEAATARSEELGRR